MQYVLSIFLGFTFTLRGDTGEEVVTIVDGGITRTVTLTKEDKLYEAKAHEISISFKNDRCCPDRNARFKSDFPTRITSSLLETWNCDSNCGNLCTACNSLREGYFNWNSKYNIKFSG